MTRRDTDDITSIHTNTTATPGAQQSSSPHKHTNLSQFIAPDMTHVTQNDVVVGIVDRSNTGLDADGVRELCTALKENRSVTDLNLSRNRFGEEGAALLEGTLDSTPALRSLDVRRWVPPFFLSCLLCFSGSCCCCCFVVVVDRAAVRCRIVCVRDDGWGRQDDSVSPQRRARKYGSLGSPCEACSFFLRVWYVLHFLVDGGLFCFFAEFCRC